MRIVSLVPSATETLYALDLGDSVVGVTHECDYPLEAADLPHLTRTVIPDGLTAREIDEEVRERTSRGEALYELDAELLRELEPDLIVTQALCAVCAVSVDDVRAVAKEIGSQPEVLSLDPSTLGEVLGDVRTLGMATNSTDEAEHLLEVAADRIDTVTDARERRRAAAGGGARVARPAVDRRPLGAAARRAGRRHRPARAPGRELAQRRMGRGVRVKPEVIVAMPCGYDTNRSADEVLDHRDALCARRREARVRGRRIRVLLAARPAAGRRARTARSHPPSGPRGRPSTGPLRSPRSRARALMGKKRSEQQIVIEAAPRECFEALVDYDTFADWQDPVKRADVLTRYDDGRGRDVEFEIDAKVRTVRYVLRYSYEEPHSITWEFLEGDVKDVEGEYVLEDKGDGATLATYSLHIDPGVWVPGPLQKVLNHQVMRRSMEDLKRHVESE